MLPRRSLTRTASIICRHFELDATDKAALTAHVRKHKPIAVISGLPYFCNVGVAEVARSEGLHYFDLTEDVAVTESVRKLAEGAKPVFAPQCGLAPGFISIAANELIQHFDSLNSVKLRVGALPQHPNNVLKYSLTWSTDGVINEYGNLCQSIVNGNEVDVLPLEGLEDIEIDGERYEAFNTSGGLGSLGETYGDRVMTMNYKTIRYPGHCEQMRLLMNGLKLNQDRGDAEAHSRERGAADAAGRRDHLRRRHRPPGRRIARGKLRQQGLSAGGCRTSVVGDPGDDRRRHLQRRRHRAVDRRTSTAASSRRNSSNCPTCSTTASAVSMRMAAPTRPPRNS